MLSTKTLLSAIKKLTESVAGGKTPLKTTEIDSIENLRAAAGAVEVNLHEFGELIAMQCGECTTGVKYKTGPIKTAQRFEEKTQNAYKGIIRCIIICIIIIRRAQCLPHRHALHHHHSHFPLLHG